MKDQPQGSVFGGYGFMRYTAPQHPHHPGGAGAVSSTSSGFAAVAQWIRACWSRR